MVQFLHHFYFFLKFRLDVLHHVRRHVVGHNLLHRNLLSHVGSFINFSEGTSAHHIPNYNRAHVKFTREATNSLRFLTLRINGDRECRGGYAGTARCAG